MMRSCLLAAVLLAAGRAHASYFEACEFEGEIRNVATDARGDFELSVLISGAEAAKHELFESVKECQEHIGKLQQAHFSRKEFHGHVSAGDTIRFYRSVVDTVDANGGYAGTDEVTRVREVRRKR